MVRVYRLSLPSSNIYDGVSLSSMLGENQPFGSSQTTDMHKWIFADKQSVFWHPTSDITETSTFQFTSNVQGDEYEAIRGQACNPQFCGSR